MQFWPNLETMIQAMLTSGIEGWMVSAGTNIFVCGALIQLALFGKRVANGVYGADWIDPFEDLCIQIVIGLMILAFWAVPVPGIGTFPHWITGFFDALAHQINQATVSDYITKLSVWQSQMESPSWANVVGTFEYWVITGAIWICQAAGFLVYAVAAIGTAVGVEMGPLFAGFMLFPGVRWSWEGFLRAFFQYSSLKCTVAIVIGIVGNFLVNTITALPHNSLEDVAADMTPIMIVLLAGIYCIFAAPTINNHYWSGSSGGGTGFIGRVVSRRW